MTSPERAPESADQVGALDRRLRVALKKALSDAQAASRHAGPEVLAVGFRCFSPGRLAVALVGTPDDEGLARLHSLTQHLGHLAGVELVVDLVRLRGCSRSLLRVINELRRGSSTTGARSDLSGWSPTESATDHVTIRRH